MPPRAPTDPDVHTLAHPVPLMMGSPCNQMLHMPGLLSWVVTVIRGSEYKASDVVPGPGSNIRHPLSVFPSLHRVPRDQFPGFIGTMRVLRLPTARPTALRFLRLAVPRLHSLRSFLDGRVRRRGQELLTRYLHPGICRGDELDLPSSWRISIIRLHVFLPTPAGLLTPDHYGAAAWPLDPQVQRLPRLGLSALNSTAFGLAVYASQDGLLRPHARLASGCWSGSTEWAFHPQDSDERFQDCVFTSLSSSPKLCLAQWGRPVHRTGNHLRA